MKIKPIPNLSDYQHLVNAIPWQQAVKSLKRMVSFLRRTDYIVVGKVGKSYSLSTYHLAKFFVEMYKDQGTLGLVKYLKTCQLLLMKSLAGDKLNDTRALGGRVSRSSKGLPRCIPLPHRKLIRAGNKTCIRYYITMFNFYRVLEVPYPMVSFKTIVNVGVSPDKYLESISAFVPVFLRSLVREYKLTGLIDKGPEWEFKFLVSNKSAPGGSATFVSAPQQALALTNSPIYPYFKEFLERVDIYDIDPLLWKIAQSVAAYFGKPFSDFSENTNVGSLALKVESAGKVRVFAKVDYWTQCLLNPLHKFLFNILERIREDGTFNQHAPLKRLIKAGHEQCFSFDLSAATDRLPVLIQEKLLAGVIGSRLAYLWRIILVGREYQLPAAKTYGFLKVRLDPLFHKTKSVKYAVGQPIGALSSWAMLALTHHFLVQLAADRVHRNQGWFHDYAILGDDVVICNSGVAKMYVQLMKEIGVELNLAKSLVAENSTTMEFAKRFIYKGSDVSGISFRELSAASKSLSCLVELVSKTAVDGTSIHARISQILRFKGKGYRVVSRLCSNYASLSRRVTLLLVFLTSPWGPFKMLPSVWITANSVNSTKAAFVTEVEERGIINLMLSQFLLPILERWSEKTHLDLWYRNVLRKPQAISKTKKLVAKHIMSLWLQISTNMSRKFDQELSSKVKEIENLISVDISQSAEREECLWEFWKTLTQMKSESLTFDQVYKLLEELIDKVDSVPAILRLGSKNAASISDSGGRWLKLWLGVQELRRYRASKGYSGRVHELISKEIELPNTQFFEVTYNSGLEIDLKDKLLDEYLAKTEDASDD